MSENEHIKSQVSSFMDGEVTHDEVAMLCKRMASDPELKDRWRDYHIISDALKQQLPQQANIDLSGRISDALDSEVAYDTGKPVVKSGLAKRVSGFAVAASVAVLGVVAVTNMTSQNSAVSPIPLAKTMTETNVAQVSNVASDAGSANNVMDPRLNKYLVDHSEYAVSASVQGMLPYARIVGHQPVRK